MPKFTPVDYDPFAGEAPEPNEPAENTPVVPEGFGSLGNVKLTPVDYDPFANDPVEPSTYSIEEDLRQRMDAAETKSDLAVIGDQISTTMKNVPALIGVSAAGTLREDVERDYEAEIESGWKRFENAEGPVDSMFALFDTAQAYLWSLPKKASETGVFKVPKTTEAGKKAQEEFAYNLASTHRDRIEDMPEGHNWLTNTTEFIGNATQGVVPSLVIGLMARTPVAIIPYAKGQEYDRLRELGYDPQLAGQLSSLAAAAEVLPEKVVIDEILKPAASWIGKVAKGATLEAGQEAITQLMQDGITAGFTDPDLTMGERLMNMFEAMAMGAFGGGVIAASVEAKRAVEKKKPDKGDKKKKDKPKPDDDVPSVEDLLGPDGRVKGAQEAADVEAKTGVKVTEQTDIEEVDAAPAPETTPLEEAAAELAEAEEAGAFDQNIDVDEQKVTEIEAAPQPEDFPADQDIRVVEGQAEVEEIELEEGQLREQSLRGRMPPGWTDPRLAREPFRFHLEKMASELVKGGGSVMTGGKFSAVNDDVSADKETEVKRTPSLNPKWFQELRGTDAAMSVEATQKAVNKALNGEKLGVREARVIGTILDNISGKRSEQVEYAKQELNKARELRRKATELIGERFTDEYERSGELFQESEYEAEWDGEARTLYELSDEAAAINAEAAERVLTTGKDNATLARELLEIIHGRAEPPAVDTQEAAAELEAETPAEAQTADGPIEIAGQQFEKIGNRVAYRGEPQTVEAKASEGVPLAEAQTIETFNVDGQTQQVRMGAEQLMGMSRKRLTDLKAVLDCVRS